MAVADKVKDALKAVDTSSFQVSTIFCAMQRARLTRSFRLRGPGGQYVTNIKNSSGEVVKDITPITQAFEDALLNFFKINNNTAPSSEGEATTPDNPFVLGYTISQKKPSLELYNPAAAASKTPTPKYFIPRTFQCTLSTKNQYSEGALNYCMLTHREPDIGTLRVVDGQGAGVFNPGPFEVARAKAVPGSCEGLLFISQDIFVNHWIANRVAPAFYVQETRTIDKIVDLLKNKYPHNRAKAGFYIPTSEISKPNVNASRDNTYQKTCAFVTSRKVIDKDGDNDPTESVKLDCGYT